MTRARDRLYLATALKDGRLQPGPGSLAEVLPLGVPRALQPGRAVTDGEIYWSGDQGTASPSSGFAALPWNRRRRIGRALQANPRLDDFLPLPSGEAIERLPVTTWVQLRPEGRCLPEDPGGREERPIAAADPMIVGRAVHRMLQDRRGPTTDDLDHLSAWALSLIRPGELGAVADSAALGAAPRDCGGPFGHVPSTGR